ncbi:MAG: hypothetical protein IKN14_04860 [Clostridiales bacterium]|nr:hypothetical protein [Clostridiales bacterium]
MRNNSVRDTASVFAVAAGMACAWIFESVTFGFPGSPLGIDTLGNIKAYIIAVLMWTSVSVLMSFLFRRLFEKKPVPSGASTLLSKGALIAGIAFAVLLYVRMNRASVPKYIIASVLFTFGLPYVLCLYDRKRQSEGSKKEKIIRIILVSEVVIFAALWFLVCGTVNTFVDFSFGRAYNVFHSSAYIDTIFNCFRGIPFTCSEAELYGHYGLFFIIPFRIFGARMEVLGIIMGLLGAASLILVSSSLIMAVKNEIIKIITIPVIGLYGISCRSIYWQSYPHRLFFPALFLFILTRSAKKERFTKAGFFTGLLLSSAALLWNTETGAVCVLIWGLYGAAAFSKEGKKRLLTAVPSVLISTALSFGISLAVVNIYNLICKGDAVLPKDFAGFQTGGFVDSLISPVDGGNQVYIHMIVIMTACLLYGMTRIFIFPSEKITTLSVFAFSAGALGLGNLTYYIHNPENSTGIIRMFFVCCAAILISKIDPAAILRSKDIRDCVKAAAAIYASFALFFSFCEGKGLLFDVKRLLGSGTLTLSEFNDFADEVSEEIAPDTKGMGFGTGALFAQMGRDKGTAGFRISKDEFAGADHILLSMLLPADTEGYELVKIYQFEDIAFGYYELSS